MTVGMRRPPLDATLRDLARAPLFVAQVIFSESTDLRESTTVTGREVVRSQMAEIGSKVDSLAHPLVNIWLVTSIRRPSTFFPRPTPASTSCKLLSGAVRHT